MRLQKLFIAAGMTVALQPALAQTAPEPILPLPTEHQIAWQKMETYAFVHYGLNTFCDREWGYGDTDPSVFNPTRMDVDQWVKTFKEAGMQAVICVAKHHDGFCLFPCEDTEYNITASPYNGPKNEDGKVDMIRELRNACDKYGLKMGLYLSPWDRNYPEYGREAYVEYYHKQLRTIMTKYGELFEIWFDGANGGDGYYGGAREKRQIDSKTYYRMPEILQMVDELQPQAIVFGDGGPGCRWVGNERGFAGATNWAFLRKGEVYPGFGKHQQLQYGHPDGNQWVPAECDVSIRPGWFYHPEEDGKVKTPEQLLDLYYRSVGHNGTFLLNFPVDREGRVNRIDSINAIAFCNLKKKELASNLLAGMTAKVSTTRKGFPAANLTDGDWDTYWATPDGVVAGTIEYKFKKPTKVNRVVLQEYTRLGQRVKAFEVSAKVGGKWQVLDCGEETTTIGHKRIVRFKTVEAQALRITISDARGPLCINNIEAYWGGEGSDVVVSNAAAFKGEDFAVKNQGKQLIIDLGKSRTINAFYYMPDQSDAAKGLIHSYELYSCDENGGNAKLLKKGEFSNIKNNPILQNVFFAPTTTTHLLLRASKMVNESESIAYDALGVKDI